MLKYTCLPLKPFANIDICLQNIVQLKKSARIVLKEHAWCYHAMQTVRGIVFVVTVISCADAFLVKTLESG